MKKISIVIFILFVLTLVIAVINTYSGYTHIKFNSKHPNITITNQESTFFNLFYNSIISLSSDKISDVNPKVIGIFYTDKERPENRLFQEDNNLTFSSTTDPFNNNEVLIYIYVSKEIIESSESQKLINEYTINTINYYKRQPNNISYKLLSNFIKIPIITNDKSY